MKRYVVNVFALLIVVGIGFAAANGYAKPPVQVEGNTSAKKVLSISENINKEYDDAVVVTNANIAMSDSGNYIRYSLRVIIPENILYSQPTTQEEATKQSELYGRFISSLSSLLELSTLYVLDKDPTLTSVSILVILPDDKILQADSSAEQLRIIARDPKVTEEAWLSSISVKNLTLVDEETWNKIQELLNSTNQSAPTN